MECRHFGHRLLNFALNEIVRHPTSRHHRPIEPTRSRTPTKNPRVKVYLKLTGARRGVGGKGGSPPTEKIAPAAISDSGNFPE
jgi:hypothetical protein